MLPSCVIFFPPHVVAEFSYATTYVWPITKASSFVKILAASTVSYCLYGFETLSLTRASLVNNDLPGATSGTFTHDVFLNTFHFPTPVASPFN